MADITKLPILTSATDGTYLLAIDNSVAKRLPFPGAGQLRGNQGYTGSIGYIGSRGLPSTVPGYTGSQGYIGSLGYTGSSGYAVDRGYTGSAGTVGPAGPNNILNASTLPDSIDPLQAIEYFVGVSNVGSTSTPIVSRTRPIVFNTALGQVGIGTTATLGTLHLKDSENTQIYFEEGNSNILHKLGVSGGNLTLDIDTTNSAGGSNFYLSQVGAHKLTMAANGNIGILTDTPAESLDVSGKLRISSSNVIAKSYSKLYALDDSRLYWENQRYAATVSSPTNVLYAGTRIVGDINPAETGGVFSFDNAPVAQAGASSWTQRLTIIENGNVGINTPRPGALLTVSKNLTSTAFVPPGDQANTTLYLVGANSAYNRFWMESFGSGGNAVNVKVSGGTAQSPSATPAGYIWFVSAAGRGTTTNLGVGQARLGIGAESTFTDTSAPTYIFFQTTGGAERLRIDSVGRIQTAGAIDGVADINIRNTATNSASGSLSLAAGPAGGDGPSYITMGNSNGLGATGPVVIQSNNRYFQIGTGTSFTDRTGGTFQFNLKLDPNGNGTVFGNWEIDGGAASSATLSTIKSTFNLVDTNAGTVNFAGAATQINMGNATGATILTRPGTVVGSNTTQNLYNTVATTMNFAGAASTLNLGAQSGTATIGNPTVLGTQAIQYLWNTVANTVYFANAATALTIGATVGGTLTVNPGTVVGYNATQNLFNTVATTMNFAGAATSLNMGSQADGSVATIANPSVEGVRYTQALWNTVPTTVNAFGAATTIALGASSGVLTFKGTTLNINGTNPTLASTNNGTLTLFDTNITTVSAFGNASLIEMAKTGGQTTIRSNVTINGSLTVSGTATSILSTNSYYTDNIIELHTPPSGVYSNWAVDDGRDIGFRFHYFNGADENAALVLANDTKYLEWYNTGAEASTGTFYGANYGTFKTGQIFLTSSTVASSTLTGALTVAGGVGIGGAVYIGGSISAGGGIRITGAFTTTNIIDSGLTAYQLVYPDSNKQLVGSTNLTFDGTTLTAANTITGKISDLSNHTTTDLSEGTNKYYHDYLARSAISVSGNLSYSSSTGVISYTTPTYTVSNFINDAHYITSSSLSVATASASGSGSLSYNNGNGVFTFTPPSLSSYITLTSLSAGTGTSYNNTNGTISIGQSVGTADSPTFAGLTVNGIINVATPDIGSTGAVRIHGNATTGFARLQIVNTAGNVEWAALKIDSTGLWQFNNDISSVGNITAYYGSSDRRLKENIKPIQDALDTVKALTGVTYDWTKDYLSKITASALPNDLGFIAQDVREILPEVVYDKGDGYLAIRYEKLTPLLLEAIKEQQATIDQMAADIALLKSKLGL